MHPGWPGWPRPPGDLGLHQTKWSGPDAPGGPRVHPGWPGRPRPPGDPGWHQTHHGGHDALIFTARGLGWPEWERQTGPTPRPLGKRLGRSKTRPKSSVALGTGASERIRKGSRGCFPPSNSHVIAAGKKVGGGTGGQGATRPRTTLWKSSRSPSPSACAPVLTGLGGLGSDRS